MPVSELTSAKIMKKMTTAEINFHEGLKVNAASRGLKATRANLKTKARVFLEWLIAPRIVPCTLARVTSRTLVIRTLRVKITKAVEAQDVVLQVQAKEAAPHALAVAEAQINL